MMMRFLKALLVCALVLQVVACGDPEADRLTLQEALSRLPQDTSSGLPEAPVIAESILPVDTSFPSGDVDEQGWDTLAIPIEPVFGPDSETAAGEGPRLQPGAPQDVEPWIPERGSVELTPEWSIDPRSVQHEINGSAILETVRSARNDGFDRVVFQFARGVVPGFEIEYVEPPIRQCGSGQVVSTSGGRWLRVRLQPAQAHDERGNATVQDRSRTPALPAIREMQLICDYEGQVEWILGVPAQLPFRSIELGNPARVVVDVTH